MNKRKIKKRLRKKYKERKKMIESNSKIKRGKK